MVVINMDAAQEKASLNSIEDQDHFYVHVLFRNWNTFSSKQTIVQLLNEVCARRVCHHDKENLFGQNVRISKSSILLEVSCSCRHLVRY